MTTGTARNGEIELAYETFGSPDGEPLLLIMGMGLQMPWWPDELCELLAGRGFAVARFDNRDFGLSTHLPAEATPAMWRMMIRPGAAAPYRMTDLADDTVAVLDALGWDRAHVFGLSLGGYVGQLLAIRYPQRMLSLTVAMSWPDPRLNRPDPRALLAMVRRFDDTVEGAQDRMVHIFRALGSPGYELDERWVRAVARECWLRDHDPGNGPRQAVAARAAGDLRPELARVRVPTLVLHGEHDRMVRPAAGRAIARAVPGARLVTYPGMGHELPRGLWPAIVEQICDLAGLASRP